MKKKFLTLMFSFALLLFASFSLVGCSFKKSNAVDISAYTISVNKNVEYTGRPIKVNVRILDKNGNSVTFIRKDTPHSDLDVFYENNINVGTAKFKVVAKSGSTKYKGELSGTFQIEGTKKHVNNINDLITNSATGNCTEIIMDKDLTVAKGQNLFIHKNTILNLNGNTLTNNGSIEQKGTLKFIYYSTRSVVINNGSYFLNNANKNEGVMQRFRGALFYNHADFKFVNPNIEGVCNYSYFYSDTDIKDVNGNVYFENFNSSDYFYRRQHISAFDAIIENANNHVYSGRAFSPKISIKKEGLILKDEYTVKYENNINAGMAKIILTANKDSKYCYGTHTFNFEIKRTSLVYNLNCEKSLQSYIDSGNYDNIRVCRPLEENITIPSYLTLTFKCENGEKGKWNFDINKLITNNGTLIFADNLTLKNSDNNISIVNNGTLKIEQNSSIDLESKIVNNAQFENNGDIFIDNTSSICDTTINNLGSIFYNTTEQLLNTTVNTNAPTQRKLFISANNISFEEVVYDGYIISPADYAKFKLNGNPIDVADEGYIIYCNREIKNAGNYNVSIVFNNNSKCFYGKDDAIFYINRAEKIIKEIEGEINFCSRDFIDAVNSGNYYSLTADFDFGYAISDENYRYMYIPDYLTVIISQGRKFYSNSYISEYGIIKPCTEVDGKIINNGTYIECGDINADFGYTENNGTVTTKGKFENNGTAYFNKVAEVNKPNINDNSYFYYPNVTTGTVYVREHITEGVKLPKIGPIYYNFTYESNYGTNESKRSVLNPSIETLLTTKNETLEWGKDYSYEFFDYEQVSIVDDWNSYRNKLAYVNIKIKNIHSQILYGSTNVSYKVLPGTAKVAGIEGFMNAINSLSFDPNYCNHNRIELIGDVASNYESRNVIILKNTTIYTNGYNFKLNHFGYNAETINNGTICIQSREGTSYEDMHNSVSFKINYKVSEGTIIGYAKTVNEFNSMVSGCDVVHLLCDVSNLDVYGNPQGLSAKPSTNRYLLKYNEEDNLKKLAPVKIYLNGHTINKISLNMANRDIEVCGGSENADSSKAKVGIFEVRGDCNKNAYTIALDYLAIDELTYNKEYYTEKVIISETVKYNKLTDNPFS